MKASPLLVLLCLSVVPAQAGPRFGAAHAAGQRHINAVSDIEPGPAPASFAPDPALVSDEPPFFAPPPFLPFLPPPSYGPPETPPVRMLRPNPQILYLRTPPRRPGPRIIYGAG